MQVTETGTVLDRIVAQTARDLEVRQERLPRQELQTKLACAPPAVDVLKALDQSTVTVIAEVKRASPSKGRFPVEIDPAEVAASYVHGGVAMISCLTDEPFFLGSLADLDQVVAVAGVASPPVGVLRKDFMIDEYQIDEARLHGASCILLIVACLEDGLLARLHAYATDQGMAALVEVHSEEELERALAIDPAFVGINNRDLKTLTVNLDVTERLAPKVPAGVVLAAESGVFTQDDVQRMADAGADAVLVGESLMLQDDRTAAVEAIRGARKTPRG